MNLFVGIVAPICLISTSVNLEAATRPAKHRTLKHSAKACRTSLDQCPDQGCGGGDAKLNVKKNRTDAPAGAIESWTFEEIMHVEDERPTSWQTGQDRTVVEELGEDTPIALVGYMIGAHPGSPETCNCKLSGEDNNDYHINLVEHKGDRSSSSVVVEMTPRVRLKHANWKLDKLTGRLDNSNPPVVRVTGYLLFDSEHVSRSGGERETIWEVHPVIKLEFCTSGDDPATCESSGTWQSLDDVE